MKTDLIFGDGPNKIYNILKKQIISGKYPIGGELKIQKISNEFKLSIVPVREAFRMLASDELIKLRNDWCEDWRDWSGEIEVEILWWHDDLDMIDELIK